MNTTPGGSLEPHIYLEAARHSLDPVPGSPHRSDDAAASVVTLDDLPSICDDLEAYVQKVCSSEVLQR
ncbi:hypothetical protein WJX72_005382 [[Myrmecia] bisecta]|uniref:Uncharacterized protein n=1 Tax=[Myrmecia] bisecta TaxID=41462 RepID=A0AAW1PP20_9CHLO